MISVRDLHDPAKASQNEAIILQKISEGRLLNWIYSGSGIQAEPAEFMSAVCDFLKSMQQRGRINGFCEKEDQGYRLPLVGGVTLARDPDLHHHFVPVWMAYDSHTKGMFY